MDDTHTLGDLADGWSAIDCGFQFIHARACTSQNVVQLPEMHFILILR